MTRWMTSFSARVPFGNWLRVRFYTSWIMHISALHYTVSHFLSLSRNHIFLNLYHPHSCITTDREWAWVVCLSHLLIKAVGVKKYARTEPLQVQSKWRRDTKWQKNWKIQIFHRLLQLFSCVCRLASWCIFTHSIYYVCVRVCVCVWICGSEIPEVNWQTQSLQSESDTGK